MSQIPGSRSERCSCRGRLVLQRCGLSARLILTISRYVTILISPHTRRHHRQHQSPAIQLLSQTDIRWDQLLLVPAASSLRPFLLMCRGLTRSSRSIHLLLIPSRRQSLNADPCGARTHIRAPTPTNSPWSLLCRESFGVSCRVCLNEMIITLQLAHVTELCLSLPCPRLLLQH